MCGRLVRRSLCFRLVGPLVVGLVVFGGTARAQVAMWRPKFQVAVGMGASFDSNLARTETIRVPSFFFAAGLGAGLLGLEVRSFANGATNQQVSRLSLELVGVLRPLVLFPERPEYLWRVLRTVAVDAGPAYERCALGMASEPRLGVSLGGHVDFPIGATGLTKEVRVRVGARRMVGATADLEALAVHDSTVELFGQLAFVF
jgi:hypothetical protein